MDLDLDQHSFSLLDPDSAAENLRKKEKMQGN